MSIFCILEFCASASIYLVHSSQYIPCGKVLARWPIQSEVCATELHVYCKAHSSAPDVWGQPGSYRGAQQLEQSIRIKLHYRSRLRPDSRWGDFNRHSVHGFGISSLWMCLALEHICLVLRVQERPASRLVLPSNVLDNELYFSISDFDPHLVIRMSGGS